ncbi:hypothetical protein SM114_16425 [Erwinia pyrifoliae]
MQKSYDYDAIVIGSGPGGEGAAMGLVKQGARIAVIERYHIWWWFRSGELLFSAALCVSRIN